MTFKSLGAVMPAALVLALVGATAHAKTVEHPAQAPRVLNNFVTELITAENLNDGDTHVFRVENPRLGWLFFRTAAMTDRSGSVRLSVQAGKSRTDVLEHGPSEKRTAESMRWLPKGECVIRLEVTDADVSVLDVRLVPIIVYERMVGSFRAMEGFPEYDRKFLRRCGMLDSVNTIGTYDGFSWMHEWMKSGRAAIRISGGVPQLNTEDKAYRHWDSSMVNPSGVNGMIVDEFYPSIGRNFPHYVKALKRIREKYPERMCLLYTAGGADTLRQLIEPLKDQDMYWTTQQQVYETHVTEQERVAQGFAHGWVNGFRKEGYYPDVSTRTIHSIGIFSGPSPSKYNDDVFPDRDWKVLRELHFHELATDPMHKGSAGIDMYQSTMCQEEYLRWMAKLCRHYLIEGSAERLTSDPYVLDHIDNPDFEQGLEGWTVEEAESGSIGVKHLKGFGFRVQGRHGHTGDHLVWMQRSADKPNRIKQQIRNLEPGRYYSVTLYTTDFQNMHDRQLHTVGILTRGRLREQPDETIHSVWKHNAEKDFGGKPTYTNYHRFVFLAMESTAELVISDWQWASVPTSPAGQELVMNFVQVEPYLLPEDGAAGD